MQSGWLSSEEAMILSGLRDLRPLLHNIATKLERIDEREERCCKETRHGLAQLKEELAAQAVQIAAALVILQGLTPPQGKMAITFGKPQPNSTISEGETDMGTGSGANLTDSQNVAATEVETDADGNPVTLNATDVAWAIDDPTIATLVQNPDGSATFTAVKPVPPATNPRTANVTCTDNVTGVVGANTLTVTTSPGGSMVITFGPPNADSAAKVKAANKGK